MALVKSQRYWLQWLDGDADFVRIFAFDLRKTFDSVSHSILCNKLRELDINPYIFNWLISYLSDRKQRVVVDGVTTKYLNINKGVPQGTVLGPILFSIMINDLKPVFPTSLLVKYADDVTLSFPIRSKDINSNVAQLEVNSIMQWADKNYMKLNLSKTWELLLKGRTSLLPPIPLTMVQRKQKLRLLGVTFEECPIVARR